MRCKVPSHTAVHMDLLSLRYFADLDKSHMRTLMIYLYLTGVHPTGVHLIGGYLLGVYLTGVHLTGVYS